MLRRKRINRYKSRSEIICLERRIEIEKDESKKEALIREKTRLEKADNRENSNYGY